MRKLLIQTVCIVLGFSQSYGQTFTEIQINNSQGVYNGESVWIDFDNDNDLDFIITGQSSTNDLHTMIYQNNGNHSFDLYSVLVGYSETGLELINANDDNFIDLIINGRALGYENCLKLFLNNGASFLSESLITDFLNSGSFGSIVSRDWNNDMKEDILITGINGYSGANPLAETKLYSKEGPNEYIESSPINGGVYLSCARFFDIDNDLDLDLIISGNDGEPPYQRSEIYINENQSYFLVEDALESIQNTSIDIGDYNNDGYVDVILTGLNEFLRDTTLLYKNVNGVLTSVENTGISDHVGRGGSVKWGDYDNDGDLDLLFTGRSSGNWSFEIMVNQGNDQFIHLEEENFENLASGSAMWGDYDKDGDLDILITGYTDINNPKLIIYRNEISNSNSPPSKPLNLSTVTNLENNRVDLSWSSSIDNETPQSSLSYNLHIIDSESNVIFSSFADLESGFLKRVWTGNVGPSTSWKFENVDNGQYISYVQAIDGGFATSQFSDSSVFFIGIPNDPENLTFSGNEGGVQLEWEDKSNNEEFFIIERSLDDESNFEPLDSVKFNIANFVDSKLPPTFNANYRVKAINPNGGSNYTSTFSSSVDGAPTDLNVSLTFDGIRLAWEDNSINEEYFIIERKLQQDESFVKIDSVTSNMVEFIDTDYLKNEVTYRVYSKNELGISDYSEEVKIALLGVEKDSDSTIKVYPNPFKKSIFIRNEYSKIENHQVEILSQEGKALPSKVKIHPSGEIELFIEDYPSKIYFINIKLNNEIFSIKMIRE